jgi:hypothetical protein
MATGKKAKDIFQGTVKRPALDLEPAPRVKGRPKVGEAYQKVTVCLFNRNVLYLDKVALAIREKTGKMVKRAELIRALVEQAAETIDPARPDFERTIIRLFPK